MKCSTLGIWWLARITAPCNSECSTPLASEGVPCCTLAAWGPLVQREYIISIVRVATFLAALELKQRVSWVMPETQGGAGGSLYSEEGGVCPAANSSSGTCSSDGGGVAEDVPVAFHVLMASWRALPHLQLHLPEGAVPLPPHHSGQFTAGKGGVNSTCCSQVLNVDSAEGGVDGPGC